MAAPKVNKALLTGFADGAAWEKFLNDLLAEAYTGDSEQFLADLASDLGDIKTAVNGLIDKLKQEFDNFDADDLKIGTLKLE